MTDIGGSAGVIEAAVPALAGTVVDVAAVTSAGAPAWLLLGEDGTIVRWDVATGACARPATARVPVEPERDRWADRVPRPRLHASADGRYAAVVNDYGRFGTVLDLSTGQATMALDNTGYQEETVPFSLAFLEHGGRTVLVHRTEWNRLDVSDPATGELLTARSSPQRDESGPSPEHYLDYFHGAVHVSPDGRRILDDGWIWHPVGCPAVWNVERWLTRDVWESEDRALTLCGRAYHWDCAMTWIDATRVAVSGIGDDADELRPGARVFDTTRTERLDLWRFETAVEVATVPGPSGRFFSDGTLLYSAAADGLETWDPVGGAHLGTVPGFSPTHHHRSGGVFLQLLDGAVRTWSPPA